MITNRFLNDPSDECDEIRPSCRVPILDQLSERMHEVKCERVTSHRLSSQFENLHRFRFMLFLPSKDEFIAIDTAESQLSMQTLDEYIPLFLIYIFLHATKTLNR